MKKFLIAAAAVAGLSAGSAQAHGGGVSIGLSVPLIAPAPYYAPAPVAYYPYAPAYYAPAAVYYQPYGYGYYHRPYGRGYYRGGYRNSGPHGYWH